MRSSAVLTQRGLGLGPWTSLLGFALVTGCTGAVNTRSENDDSPDEAAVDEVVEDGDDTPRDDGDDQGGRAGGGGGGGVAFAPAAPRWQRLTAVQLRNSLEDLFGSGLPARDVEPDLRDHGFVNIGGAKVATSSQGVERYSELAHAVAADVMGKPERRTRLVTCDLAGAFDDCARETLRRLTLRAFRRPAPTETLDALAALARRGRELTGEAFTGLEHAVAAVLQSPRFLYIEEVPVEKVTAGMKVRVDDYTLASRLSYFLTNTTPDAALLEAAERGELANGGQTQKHAQRLLASPRAAASFREIVSSAFGLHKVAGRTFDASAFPNVPSGLGESALEGSLRHLAYHIVERGDDLRAALLSNETFVDAKLAKLYGVPAPSGTGFERVQLPASSERAGLLTQIAFLAADSTPTDTQPMLRGRAILESFLCQRVPEPPPDLMATLPPVPAGKTMTKRERLAQHRTDPFCASCHDTLDPAGLALENYDAVGAFRSTDGGLPIDASGELDGQRFTGGKELARVLVNAPATSACFVRHVYRYATGHVEEGAEEPLLEALAQSFYEEARQLPALVTALVTSEAFTHTTMPTL